ncbi:MAG: hypothetical protein JWO42_4144 [Chloroflexi bacterium]|nr:hypothetical protein [Chloroflexota bacterium]
MTLRVSLDRDLPVSISTQLKGQIEYGIVSGVLKPGEQLPSVRELSAAEGIAHVTVSHVYSALKREGLIVMRPGMGTYVAGDGEGHRAGQSLGELQRLVDTAVVHALERGFTPVQISRMLTARLASRQARRLIVALVGVFGHATEVYARELHSLLDDINPDVAPYTIERLHAGGEERSRVCEADLILTIANRVKEVQTMLPRKHPPLRGLTFVAHPETVRQLQALPENLQLGVISTFAEFLPTMLRGITTYARLSQGPQCAVLSDVDRVNAVLAQADAVVYATGSGSVVNHVRHSVPVIEYLHAPEPSSVAALRPLLEHLTVSRSGEGRYAREWKEASKIG